MAQIDFREFHKDIDMLTENILVDTAEAMIRYIESSDVIPVDTHNLKDSAGVGVYRSGTLKKFVMPRKAEEPRIINWVAIWGEDMIDHVLNTGMSNYGNGDHIVLFTSMPYAEEVDSSGRNSGFFTDMLSTEFELILDEIVKLYGRKS